MVHLVRDSQFDKACSSVHQFVDQIISRALENESPQDSEKTIEGSSERYVFLTELLKSTRDPKQLRNELLNILLAGRDTIASLLSNTFHVLARRPDIWNKLKAEVDSVGGVKPDYETLRSMKYLKNVLNESKFRPRLLLQSDMPTPCRSPALPRGPQQRKIRQQRHNSPSRRRSRWFVSHLHTEGRNCRVFGVHYASPEGHLRPRCRGIQP